MRLRLCANIDLKPINIGENMNILIVIDVSEPKPKSLYAREFKTHPRIGEWIEIDEDDEGVMYEVIKVAHSSVGAGSDLYVKRVELSYKAVESLCGKND